MSTSTDRIEKKILLRAPRSRVWRAVSNAAEFGEWFGVKLEGDFVPGEPLRGKITNPPGYENLVFEVVVDEIVPERRFSFRWHPYAIEPSVDYSDETPTLVTFQLEEVDGGTHLTVTESGFDSVPAARRAKAFQMNDMGWGMQLKAIEKYVGG